MSIAKMLKLNTWPKSVIENLLNLNEPANLQELFNAAFLQKHKLCGNKIYTRGLIEISNICQKNCFYCGIRQGNTKVNRYVMHMDEVIAAAKFAFESGYGSIVIQAGEQTNNNFIDFITKAITNIKQMSNNELGITLSLGEQTEQTYKTWFNAGATRYLLRIETSNEYLYKSLHPANHSFAERVNCLQLLHSIGYYVGSGVLIGAPGQSISDLAEDILFLKNIKIDMIGMGPYISAPDTPLFTGESDTPEALEERLSLTLKMIAICRLIMPNINIASTTALQTINTNGRNLGILAGANVIMPMINPIKYRAHYSLYNGKPFLDKEVNDIKNTLDNSLAQIGEQIAYNELGNPLTKQTLIK